MASGKEEYEYPWSVGRGDDERRDPSVATWYRLDSVFTLHEADFELAGADVSIVIMVQTKAFHRLHVLPCFLLFYVRLRSQPLVSGVKSFLNCGRDRNESSPWLRHKLDREIYLTLKI